MRDDKNMIFFTRYWCARHTAVDLSIHLPPGRMTVKNSDRFDNIGQWEEKAAPRLCSIVKHFYHFLCSEIVVYFFFCPFVWCLGVCIWLETNNNVQSVSVSSIEHLFSIRVAFDRPYKMKLRRMNGVIMVNIAFVSFDKLRLSDMAIETSLCITKNESGTYLSQCQASTVLIIIFIRFIFTFWSEKETKIYRKIDMLPQCGTEHIAFQVHAECSQKCVIALFVALFIRM